MGPINEAEEFEFRARAEQEQGKSQPKPGLMRRGWDAFKWPEQKSQEGLNMIAKMIPEGKITGNMPMDLLRGTPRIAANTLAKAAPPMVSRGSLMLGGGLKALKYVPEVGQVMGGMGRGLGRQLESASGIAPQAEGALESAYKDPSIMFGRGKGAVSQMYKSVISKLQPQNAERMSQMIREEQEALQAKKLASTRNYLLGKTPQIEPVSQPSTVGEIKSLKNEIQPRRMVIKAEKLADKGVLNPDDALEARKELDPLIRKGKIVKSKGLEMRAKFDRIAKTAFAEPDSAYQRAMKSEALRNILPQNKYGGASPFKAMLLKLTGGAAAPLLSPALQGAGSAGLGMAERGIVNPMMAKPTLSMAAMALRKLRGQDADSNP
jgi:hypothetical protein